ncbi:TAP-like protein-domain-containing protein [Xylogone sp. PMI_703]|nr:TAP-like protein-domain-containing protein [Xylogone sp. PMI_703]
MDDEKIGLLPRQPSHRQIRKEDGKRRYLVAIVILFWLSVAFIFTTSLHGFGNKPKSPRNHHSYVDDILDITPSEKLEWYPCYETMLCARLTVAMDYRRPLNASQDNPKVHIALIMKPGIRSTLGKYSRSPLLVNPGGPGGSGLGIVLRLGSQIQQVVGLERDIIGFDPRGIGATIPRADCFAFPPPDAGDKPEPGYEDSQLGFDKRLKWLLMSREVGLVNSSSTALKSLDIRAKALGKLCEEKDAIYGDNSILRFSGTPNVARDMLSIIDAWDDWLELHDAAEPLVTGETETLSSASTDSYPLDTKGKLVYWGFSYGSFLGATFASMFPDRVGRVILDGVVDADLYVSPIWEESLLDADKVLESFFKYCYEAGEKCAIYKSGDNISAIEGKYRNIMTDLEESPIYFVEHITKVPVILYHTDVKQFLFQTLYSPVTMFPLLAELLKSIDQRSMPQMMQYIQPGFANSCLPKYPAHIYPTDAQAAIMCSDKRYHLNETIDNLELMFEEMAKISSFADIWMTLMIGCDSWAIETHDPPMRWDDHPAHKPKPIKTAFPLLFISNSADPVTPLYAGVKMAKKFVGAGLIEQISGGHCSLAAASRCTLGKIRAYLNEGKVPPVPEIDSKGKELEGGKWDRCEPDEWPWKPLVQSQDFTTEEMEVLDAWKKIQDDSENWQFWASSNIHDTKIRNTIGSQQHTSHNEF